MIKDNAQAKLEAAVGAGVIDEEEETLDKALSSFRLLSDNAIPIPPTIGDRFATLFDEGVRMLDSIHQDWKHNIAMFNNEEALHSQLPLENLVRTTVESLVDFTYMKNPTVEMTATTEEVRPLAKVLEKLLNAVINKKTLPGINLRPKILRQIIYAHLTNFGILELTWQGEKGSIEQLLEINDKVKEKIKTEQDPEVSAPLYELLDIVQRELDVRRHVGIGVRSRSPFSLILDPNGQELDLSDHKWLMFRDNLNVNHIKAEYMQWNEEEQKYFFKYNPNVEFDTSAGPVHSKESVETDIINSIMPDVDDEHARLRSKDTIAVVWVYDKTTRLKYLYMEGRWDIPLWVYEDEMGLSRFFPFFVLAFSTSLNTVIQPGEVSHYTGFQHEINQINKQMSRVRNRGFNKYLYNSTVVDPEEAKKIFDFVDSTNSKVEAIGVKLRSEDVKLNEILEPFKMPSTQFAEIFNTKELREAHERTTRVSPAMRGSEFKTNTTNQAIATYNDASSNRLEGLTGKIELTTEDVLWALCELMVSKMSPEQVSQILTPKEAKDFYPMSVEEFNTKHELVLAAGSIEKPNSQTKKQEAVQIIQMLGQFGTAAPRTVLSLVTRLLKSAFSKSLVTEEDLNTLKQEGLAAMQKGISTQQQQQPGAPQPQQPRPKGPQQ